MAESFDYDPETGELLGETKPNLGEYSVSEISQALKRTLEDRFGHVRVRGEISGYRGPHASGHCYFAIKDEGAKLDAVIWRGSFGRLRAKMQEGLEVIATGKITSYPGKSAYQIIVENIEPAGVGALMALLEERRKKLAAEGLFDAARKKPIPYLPRLIGVVTSPTGAVIRDILHRLNDRFPRRVLVWPVRVQGETSAAEVAAAIAGFNAMADRPDVIIVARGGGSLEDLWGFNEEIVVRAVAASAIPVISAVGHETDTTLIDHVADLRAPTPTAAAERAVPVRSELLASLASLASRHSRGLSRYLDERRTRVTSAARALPKPDELLALARQRFDAAAGRLSQGLRTNTHLHRAALDRAAARLQPRTLSNAIASSRKDLKRLEDRSVLAMRRLLQAKQQSVAVPLQPRSLNTAIQVHRRDLTALAERAGRALRRVVETRSQALAADAKLLASLSYRSVLQRGFALVRDMKGNPVRAAAAVRPFQPLRLEFADGEVKVKEDGAPKQGSLF